MTFERPLLATLLERLLEPRNKIHILSGPRQVGKTTLSIQALEKIEGPKVQAIAESRYSTTWLDQQWALARSYAHQNPQGCILVIDEIQKIPRWSERVKRLWDEDTIRGTPLKVLLLGSSSLLLHQGLSESMMGRFEILHVPHWSFNECEQAFSLTLEEYLYFGGYPGSLMYRHQEDRFLSYIKESIIEPVVSRDILSQFIVHKPALLHNLFHLGCEYSGQILSYNKMLGQLQDAGNVTTLAHYLNLLEQAGVLTGLPKFSIEKIRRKQSSPKLQVYNTALRTSVSEKSFQTTIGDPELKGWLVESAVGTSLLIDNTLDVCYWRENNQEVDFVVRTKGKVVAIEVKSGKRPQAFPGMEAFTAAFHPDACLLVGSGGIPLDLFLKTPFHQFL